MSEAVFDSQGRPLDQVSLLGVRAHGYHGVHAEERRDGQEFTADVVLHLDTRAAAATDDLTETVSYADLAEKVGAVLTGPPVQLLESLADRIAHIALSHDPVAAVDVTIHKPRAPLTVPFRDVQVRIRRSRHEYDPLARRPTHPQSFALGLGANLGDALATLRAAVAELQATAGLEITAISPLARTGAVLAPGQGPQPDYLNAVVVGRAILSPRELLSTANRIEDHHGRRRAEPWGARTLDVDVLTVGNIQSNDPQLTLPHPRAHERAFVLAPWAQTDPEATVPGHGLVTELAERAMDNAAVHWVAQDWLTQDPTGGSRARER